MDQGGDTPSNKLLALAKDIGKNGLHPSELLIAKQSGTDGFVVMEGNRRIAAIKCALDPSILPIGFDCLSKRFSCIEGEMPKEIKCYVSDDDEEIARLIESRHNGQSKGIGTIPWNSEQRARFMEGRTGKTDKIVRLIDFLFDHFGKNSAETVWLSKCKKTNLERLFSSPYVREKLGFELVNSEYFYSRPNDALLSRFLEKLAETSVGDIYFAARRREFVDDLIKEFNVDDIHSTQESPADNLPFDTAETNVRCKSSTVDSEPAPTKDNTYPRPKAHQLERRTVAPRAGSPLQTEGRPKIAQVHRELKALDASESPIACGLLMRTLIELVTDFFLSAKLDPQEYAAIGRGYSGRIQKACNELVNDASSDIQNNDVDYMRKFSQNKDVIPITMSSLNSIAHSEAGFPDAQSLIQLWDKTYIVIRAMLNYGRS